MHTLKSSSVKSHCLFLLSIGLPLILSFILLAAIPASYSENEALTFAKVFWFTGALFVVTNILGFLYGSPHRTDTKNIINYGKSGWPSHSKLVVSYVSRGDNVVALRRAIKETKAVLTEMHAQFTIEAVTDMKINIKGIESYLVPLDYQTKKGSMYKARALHYLIGQRRERLARRQNIWVLHLDEESIMTPESVAGIASFIEKYKGKNVIGQGEIQYNAYNYADNLLIASIDSIRTGDDLGRFRLQYKFFQKPLFGMHGSFVLLPRTLEQKIGFDLTRKGSITEDAYFALIAMSRGYKFHWVDGFIREQSPFSITALLKQRRRWISGLKSLVFDNDIPLRVRATLSVNMFLWAIAWAGPLVTMWNILAGGSVLPDYLAVAAAILSGVVGGVYMVGAWRNASVALISTQRKLVIWISSLVLFPIACIIEGVAVLYAAVFPVKTFQVVDK